MLRTTRDLLLRATRIGGGFRLIARSKWRRDRLLILCYHGFSLRDEHEWNPALSVTAGHLAGRLRLLAAGGYTVLPLGEAVEGLRGGHLPPQSVAITVDDGFHNFKARAYPLLEEAGVPVTVFASSYYVVDQRPVFSVMASYLLWRGMKNQCGAVDLPRVGLRVHPATSREASEAARRVHATAESERWSADDKHDMLAGLAEAMGEDWEGLLRDRVLGLMTPAEIRSLDPAIADVQLHTHRHRTPRDRAGFLREVRDNRAALAEAGRNPAQLVHFCYPSGVHHPEFLPWLREAGVETATTCVPALAERGTEPLLLPRFIDATTTPSIEFEAWACGVRHLIRRRIRQFSGS